MEAIAIHPENPEQLKTIKAVLKALKVPFESQNLTLPPHVLKGIEKGIEQYEKGETITLNKFKEKHFSKK
ncbi:hypothetical protein IWX76_002149 [Pedobacter sp. CAN_A7]|uniref:DUF2683 family protein n=1 Tax=Pedobacter sp. CAN_A7 TaxID=2787722 RepID=UPI0018CB5745